MFERFMIGHCSFYYQVGLLKFLQSPLQTLKNTSSSMINFSAQNNSKFIAKKQQHNYLYSLICFNKFFCTGNMFYVESIFHATSKIDVGQWTILILLVLYRCWQGKQILIKKGKRKKLLKLNFLKWKTIEMESFFKNPFLCLVKLTSSTQIYGKTLLKKCFNFFSNNRYNFFK